MHSHSSKKAVVDNFLLGNPKKVGFEKTEFTALPFGPPCSDSATANSTDSSQNGWLEYDCLTIVSFWDFSYFSGAFCVLVLVGSVLFVTRFLGRFVWYFFWGYFLKVSNGTDEVSGMKRPPETGQAASSCLYKRL